MPELTRKNKEGCGLSYHRYGIAWPAIPLRQWYKRRATANLFGREINAVSNNKVKRLNRNL